MCPVTLYVDGLPIYSPMGFSEMPDLDRYDVSQIAGVEFYPGGASLLPKFNTTGNVCGVLLIWTRDQR